MAKAYAKAFYKSDAWHRCRRAYIQKRLQIDGGRCEVCHRESGYIVHHKVYITRENINDPNITLNESNLMYVCKACHDNFDGHGVHGSHREKAKAVFDDAGQPIDVRHPPI